MLIYLVYIFVLMKRVFFVFVGLDFKVIKKRTIFILFLINDAMIHLILTLSVKVYFIILMRIRFMIFLTKRNILRV